MSSKIVVWQKVKSGLSFIFVGFLDSWLMGRILRIQFSLSICLSVRLYHVFLGIHSLLFFGRKQEVKCPWGLKSDRAHFFGKIQILGKVSKRSKMAPKQGFWTFKENEVISFVI